MPSTCRGWPPPVLCRIPFLSYFTWRPKCTWEMSYHTGEECDNEILGLRARRNGNTCICVWLFVQSVSFYKTKPTLRLCLSDENPKDKISLKASTACFISLDYLLEENSRNVGEKSLKNLTLTEMGYDSEPLSVSFLGCFSEMPSQPAILSHQIL